MRLLPILALSLFAGPAFAEQRVLRDYSDKEFRLSEQSYSEADQQRIATALTALPNEAAKEMAKKFVILGDAKGAFSAPRAEERIYLIQRETPVAIDPFPSGPPPLLLAMKGDETTGLWSLSPDEQYQRLIAAANGLGDGRDEVLLETSHMQMGELSISVDLVSLGDKGQVLAQDPLTEGYFAACDGSGGSQSSYARTILVGPDGFTTVKHDLPCEE